MHDARIFKESYVSKVLSNHCENGEYHIIGDSAYPIRPYLLTPFRHTAPLSAQQINYNNKFCGSRVVIENCFGILKKRFRQLLLLDFWTVDKITLFIISCCVLHNLCIIADDVNDFFDVPAEDWVQVDRNGVGYDEPEDIEPADIPSNVLKAQGERKRNDLMRML